MTFAEYLTLPRAAQTWLVESLLPTGGALLLYGDPKVGKSFAALQLAAALTQPESKRAFLGFPIPNSATCVYIQLDTPRSLWADRAYSVAKSGIELSHVLFADRETLGCWPFDILRDDHQALLAKELSSLRPDCVIIDTLREAHSADENDATPMQAVVARLTAACQPAACVVVAHSRKPNAERGPDLMNDNRGSNYIVGRMDAIVRFGHSSMRVSGRAIDEQTIPLVREDNGFWSCASDPHEAEAEEILQQALPLREKARLLAAKTGKSESAARAYLRRRAGKG